jgi:hypothetical protein
LSALFAVQGEQLRALTDYEEDLAISAIVDANLDGNLELLGQAFGGFDGEANVLMQARDKPTVLLDTTPPFHDCGC